MRADVHWLLTPDRPDDVRVPWWDADVCGIVYRWVLHQVLDVWTPTKPDITQEDITPVFLNFSQNPDRGIGEDDWGGLICVHQLFQTLIANRLYNL